LGEKGVMAVGGALCVGLIVVDSSHLHNSA
jgi:hypothetical protein